MVEPEEKKRRITQARDWIRQPPLLPFLQYFSDEDIFLGIRDEHCDQWHAVLRDVYTTQPTAKNIAVFSSANQFLSQHMSQNPVAVFAVQYLYIVIMPLVKPDSTPNIQMGEKLAARLMAMGHPIGNLLLASQIGQNQQDKARMLIRSAKYHDVLDDQLIDGLFTVIGHRHQSLDNNSTSPSRRQVIFLRWHWFLNTLPHASLEHSLKKYPALLRKILTHPQADEALLHIPPTVFVSSKQIELDKMLVCMDNYQYLTRISEISGHKLETVIQSLSYLEIHCLSQVTLQADIYDHAHPQDLYQVFTQTATTIHRKQLMQQFDVKAHHAWLEDKLAKLPIVQFTLFSQVTANIEFARQHSSYAFATTFKSLPALFHLLEKNPDMFQELSHHCAFTRDHLPLRRKLNATLFQVAIDEMPLRSLAMLNVQALMNLQMQVNELHQLIQKHYSCEFLHPDHGYRFIYNRVIQHYKYNIGDDINYHTKGLCEKVWNHLQAHWQNNSPLTVKSLQKAVKNALSVFGEMNLTYEIIQWQKPVDQSAKGEEEKTLKELWQSTFGVVSK